ncbi:MAG: ATP-binding protein [Candidatus Moraniibacteriota bacterium]
MNVDPKLTRIVFQNLLTNAVKYTPPGGTISISVAMNQDGKIFTISVADTGYGIPKEDWPRIFTKLFRASNICEKETDGTGLGLYIIKSIIEHSDGTVAFKSEEGKGTTFTITLPVSGMHQQEGNKQIEWKEPL